MYNVFALKCAVVTSCLSALLSYSCVGPASLCGHAAAVFAYAKDHVMHCQRVLLTMAKAILTTDWKPVRREPGPERETDTAPPAGV